MRPTAQPKNGVIQVQRTLLSGKIHRATVTQADLHYVGSLTIDEDLMEAADVVDGELVHVLDIDNGNRLVTYAITGERGSGIIGINGAAAHLVEPGHLVIIITYGQYSEAERATHQPRVVHVDADNRVIELDSDPGAPTPGSPEQRSGRVPAH